MKRNVVSPKRNFLKNNKGGNRYVLRDTYRPRSTPCWLLVLLSPTKVFNEKRTNRETWRVFEVAGGRIGRPQGVYWGTQERILRCDHWSRLDVQSKRRIAACNEERCFLLLAKSHCCWNWKAKAIEHNGKFLTLWKDADAGIAEVEDAKKRLAGLNELI